MVVQATLRVVNVINEWRLRHIYAAKWTFACDTARWNITYTRNKSINCLRDGHVSSDHQSLWKFTVCKYVRFLEYHFLSRTTLRNIHGLYNNMIKEPIYRAQENVNLAIISEMESLRVVKSNGVRKVRQIYKVGYAHTKTSPQGPHRKNLRWGTISEGGSLSDLRMRQDKTEHGTALSIVLIQS